MIDDDTAAAVMDTAKRLAAFYEEAMLEHGLTEEEVDTVHQGVVRRQLNEILSRGI